MGHMISPDRIAKAKWHCRRGMLELDLMLQCFVKNQLKELSDSQFIVFEHLLSFPDPDLYAWLMGYEKPESKELVDIVAYIRLHDHPK